MEAIKSTPVGAPNICAFFYPWIKRLFRARPSLRIPTMSDRIARDIGISPADQDRLNLRWPSEKVQHPYW